MKEVADALSSRLKSPYFGYAILAFFALNWRELFLFVVSTSSPQDRIAEFDATTGHWSLLYFPLLVGAAVAASSPWIRLLFAFVARKPLELAEDMQLMAEHRKTIRQSELEQSRSEFFAMKENELIERAKRDEKVAGIEDSEAKEKLAVQLENLRRERDQLSEQLKTQNGVGSPSVSNLSQEEAEILSAAASNKNGSIIKPKSIGARTIQSGGASFGSDSPRDFARYEEALNNLVHMGFVKEVGEKGEMFHLTSKGWKVADAL